MVDELDYRKDPLDNVKNLMSEKNPSPKVKKFQETWKKWLTKIDPTRENLVATFNLNCKLDLKAIKSRLDFIVYDPKSFDALVLRLGDPNTTVLLLASGKAMCTGAKTVTEARRTAVLVATILSSSMGYNVEYLNDFKVEGVSTGIQKLGGEIYKLTKDGALVEVSRARTKKGWKRYGACVPGIPKCVKGVLVALGLVKNSEAN